MQRSKIPLSVLAAIQCACVAEPELLNSERIEQTFGNYNIEVIHSDDQFRQSVLSSKQDDVVTARTFAVTRFSDAISSKFQNEHSAIIKGASIGSTLKSAGWTVLKASLHVGHVDIDDADHPVLEMMRLDAPSTLAIHIYKLSVRKNDESIEYATITELHHPDYLDVSKLRELFPVEPSIDSPQGQVDEIITIILDAA